MGHATLTPTEARLLLGLPAHGDASGLTHAFRAAVKAARPDRPGGDPERFRRVIEAYRLLQPLALPALTGPARAQAYRPVATLDIATALAGGTTVLALGGGRRLRIAVPAGMRTGEHLRLRGAGRQGEDLFVQVRVRGDGRLRLIGDDLHMDWTVEARLMADGGRIEIQTHAGPRSAWLTGGGVQPPRLRLRGLGLPARGARPQGHLFVTLIEGEDTPSAAAHLLHRFSAVWTPDRLAA